MLIFLCCTVCLVTFVSIFLWVPPLFDTLNDAATTLSLLFVHGVHDIPGKTPGALMIYKA
ncbi:hypothetical protein HA49_15815 [Tatumella morbirosei]|uniref:Uncharacterized protein n=1 Tax=Tatumella morbirosei TaxID=642227 RepID=A0A095UCR3_9GAMM|nr:hypothetical protein HA49_15815 [Tatumella morbirosei]